MKNTCFFTIIIYYTLTFITNAQSDYPKDYFTSPVNIKIALAGTFGELRNDHFHSGIDIKTKQKKNIPIYAAQDGYISRIKVSTYGFGKALYINHANGFTTVYAHLENFNDKIQTETKKKQYEKESFEIDFPLKNNRIIVKKGELIGFSGNTGSSTAPHLHFEIRDTKTQKIINPMLFGLPILDRTKPIINSILIYHNNGEKKIIKPKKISEGNYQINNDLKINGTFNLAINTLDLLDSAPNQCGVYSIELHVNDTLFFLNEMNTFAFNETKYINSHIDYSYYKNHNRKFQKCFLDPNNRLTTNQKHANQNIGTFLNKGLHKIKIIVKDSYANSSTLIFNIHLLKDEKLNLFSEKFILDKENIINANQVFEFQNEDCKIYIPNQSLYNDYLFIYEKMTDSLMAYPIYKIMDDSIPSHKSFIISIKLDSLDKSLRKKAIIVRLNNGQLNYIRSEWKENAIVGKSNKFGNFTIAIDTIKPIIQQSNKTQSNTIAYEIKDELSGIKEYRGEIDGKWILMEYDFKTNLLIHTFETKPEQKDHTLTLSVSDNVGNNEVINIDFFR